MAYAGGIGQEIDQLKDLSVQELVRRQKLDPSLIYTIALQEKEKMNAAGARQGVLDEPKPEGTVTSQMEQELAQQTMPQSPVNRLAPGVMQQGQRSMQQPQPQQRPQMAQGISGAPANNMGAVGRARGGIIEYANGGMPQTQTPTTGAQQAAPVTPVTPEQVAAFRARLKELNEAKAKAFPQEKAMFQQQIQDLLATTPAAIRNAAGGAGMAFGGVVGERDRAIDMDALLDALMMAESGGDPNAVSRAGAEGLYQIMPSTGRQPGFGVEPLGDAFDPQESRRFARDYLQAMLDRYDGDVEAALIAYNAGFRNADKFIAADRNLSALPRRDETEPYVRKIMGHLEKEDRRRDLQMGGGRTIPTTAPESYTEKRRRERLGRQEAGLASLYPEVAMEEAEMYEPNLPDALTVMQAMESLRDGPEEANAPAEGIAGYLKNIGRQQQQRRDDFREAVPGAEAAVARAEQEKEDGGIGYLRRLGRLQEGAAQRQAEEEKRAAQFLAMLQQNEDMLAGMDPAENMPIQKFEKGGSPNSYGGGSMGGLGEYTEMAMDWASENPVDALATGLMFIPGIGWGAAAGAKGIALTAKVVTPILKKYGNTAGQKIIQGIKTLGTKATTKPNPAAVPRVGNKPGQVTKGVVQPTQGVRGPGGRMQAGPPGRVIDPLRIAGGTGLAIKAGEALLGGEDEATGPTTQQEFFQELARKQEEAGTVEASRARRRAEEAAQRNQTPDKTGISGALDKAKPLGSLALKLAKVLGRGGGASEGFEFAKINEESSRLRSEEAKMQLARDQIAATTGQNQTRADATVNAMIGKAITDYTEGMTGGYREALIAKALELKLEEGDPKIREEVIKDFVTMLRNNMIMGGLGSVQGLGEGEGAGLPEDVASAQAYLAETS